MIAGPAVVVGLQVPSAPRVSPAPEPTMPAQALDVAWSVAEAAWTQTPVLARVSPGSRGMAPWTVEVTIGLVPSLTAALRGISGTDSADRLIAEAVDWLTVAAAAGWAAARPVTHATSSPAGSRAARPFHILT